MVSLQSEMLLYLRGYSFVCLFQNVFFLQNEMGLNGERDADGVRVGSS